MGLLTDSRLECSWLVSVLLSHHKLLSTILYLLGSVWFVSLAHNSMNHGTYFSENALLPGLVQGEFMGESVANRYLYELTAEVEHNAGAMPHAWLLAKLTQLGLDTHAHNFTLHYPMALNKSFSGSNVYGILRAVRGSSTESIVVSAPYRAATSPHSSNAPAIALILALAHFFAGQVYWAKDVVFLISEHEQLGVEAWLQAYHGTTAGTAGVLDHGVLPARAGPIQAAVNLEISSKSVAAVDIRYEGLNGQLPNLDLVNLLHRLCHRENVRHTTKNRHDHPRPDSFKGWVHQLGTLAASVATQASGVPSGNHGLFHRYGIAAVTMAGTGRGGSGVRGARPASLLHLGRVLEGTCRSLNNLLERFHQSFFFYLLPSTSRYISIGVYMPAFGMLGSSLLLVALALWCSSSIKASEAWARRLDQEQREKQGDKHDKHSVDHKLEKTLQEGEHGERRRHRNLEQEENIKSYKQKNEVEQENSTVSPRVISYSLVSCCGVVVLVHVVCLLVCWCPRMLAVAGAALLLPPEDSVLLGLVAFSAVTLMLPHTLRRHLGPSRYSWEVVKCVAVLELSVLVFAGSVHNFSLALLITLIYAPVVLLVAPSHNFFVRWLRALLLLAVHPLSLLLFFVSVDTILNFPMERLQSLAFRIGAGTKRALMYSVVDSMVYGNWVFPVACSCLLPVWMLLWHVQHYDLDRLEEDGLEKKAKDT